MNIIYNQVCWHLATDMLSRSRYDKSIWPAIVFWQVCCKLSTCGKFIVTIVAATCNKSANDKLQQAWFSELPQCKKFSLQKAKVCGRRISVYQWTENNWNATWGGQLERMRSSSNTRMRISTKFSTICEKLVEKLNLYPLVPITKT